MNISRAFIDELKQLLPIEDLISSYVSLNYQGSNLKGLCPFHNEKTPSFTVFPKTESFYCFGCQKAGDIVTFVMEMEHLDYVEAVEFLANKAGITIPLESTKETLDYKKKQIIYEINKKTARIYMQNLYSNDKDGIEYLKTRRVTKDIAKRFGLGLSFRKGQTLTNLLLKDGYSKQDLLDSNVSILNSENKLIDRFSHRLIFPIIDAKSRVIGFGARALGDSIPKYLNTADTLVFKKSRELYAINEAKKSYDKPCILTEGYMDAISLHSIGINNAVATLGTSLTYEHMKNLRHFSKVYLCYDSDLAGIKASNRASSMLRESKIDVSIIQIKGAKDPDEFIKKDDSPYERFMVLIKNAKTDIEFKLNQFYARNNTKTNEGKTNFLDETVKLLSTIEKPLEREVYAQSVAKMLLVSKENILEQIDRHLNNQKTTTFNEITEMRNKLNNKEEPVVEARLLAFMFTDSDKKNVLKLCSTIDKSYFQNELFSNVFAIYKEALKINLDSSLLDISSSLTDEERSIVAKIIAQYSDDKLTSLDFSYAFNALKTAYLEKKVIDNASDDSLLEFFNEKRKSLE